MTGLDEARVAVLDALFAMVVEAKSTRRAYAGAAGYYLGCALTNFGRSLALARGPFDVLAVVTLAELLRAYPPLVGGAFEERGAEFFASVHDLILATAAQIGGES